jgi:hypothetical protein
MDAADARVQKVSFACAFLLIILDLSDYTYRPRSH